MAARKKTSTSPKGKKKSASGDATLRDHVREISVGAFRDRRFSLRDVSSLVHEVLDSAVENVDKSIPASNRNVLRQVFDGLSEGVHAAASASAAVAEDAGERFRKATKEDAPAAARRIREANDQFLSAVKAFAGKTTRQAREELDLLVAKAEKTGPKLATAARDAAKAADGRWMELTGETARTSATAARRTAGTLAATAGGFFDGLAEAVRPKAPAAARAKKAAPKKKPTRKAAGKRKPAARKKRVAKK